MRVCQLHLLEEEAAKRLGLQTDFIVRTAEEWKRIIADNPLPDYAERDPSHLLAFPLKQARNPQDFLSLHSDVEKYTGCRHKDSPKAYARRSTRPK